MNKYYILLGIWFSWRVDSLNLREKIEEIMCLNHGPPFHIIRNQWIELKTTNPH
jgi:hypothetical protein